MDERRATALAEALGGETWQSGGDICLVILRGSDGRLVVVSDDVVCEYADAKASDNSEASKTIYLR